MGLESSKCHFTPMERSQESLGCHAKMTPMEVWQIDLQPLWGRNHTVSRQTGHTMDAELEREATEL